ncbi:hypothetical protein Godav_006790 [Gossypium davidsonii]|uniref:RING-type E3 ubiquitin transferase n=2 Tax=Gossypium TaxID=3633 RepID=A0A7J8S4W9_GOSDV|nr:hypothetical protein [Gossypium davidsonii]MBA0656600.1 hypothetical protein [Gossypium klotzschianum]
MASYSSSFSHQRDGLYHDVYQPRTRSKRLYPVPQRVQIEVTISFNLITRHHHCLTDRLVTVSDTHFRQESRRFDLQVLRNQDQAYQILGAMLRRFQIDPTSLTFDVIDKIIRHGLRISKWGSNMGRQVLPVRAKLWEIVTRHLVDDRALLRRALAESALLTNNTMVPANETSVKKMLKRVRVEDRDQRQDVQQSTKKRRVEAESCTICLEEIKVGSSASQMPCSHMFHSGCIEKWLKQSHYCPLCRFELPT